MESVDRHCCNRHARSSPTRRAAYFSFERVHEREVPIAAFAVFLAEAERDVKQERWRNERVILRELSLDTGFEFKDFHGNMVAGQKFGERYDSFVTPTLLFLDANGHSLTDPIVGTGNIEFYGFYLDRKIKEATDAIDAHIATHRSSSFADTRHIR